MTKELVQSQQNEGQLLRVQPPAEEHGKKRGFNTLELLGEFQAFSRQPFIEIMAELISGIPTPENIHAFANDHPDRWAQCIKTMANLSGYHDKLEIKGNVLEDMNKLGDAQLIARLKELGDKIDSMGIRTGLVSDAEYEDVPEAKKEATSEDAAPS